MPEKDILIPSHMANKEETGTTEGSLRYWIELGDKLSRDSGGDRYLTDKDIDRLREVGKCRDEL